VLILDGPTVRNSILDRLKPRIQKLARRPGLAVVLVGHNPASEIYVRGKIKACGEIGMFSEKITPPETITTEELLAIIDDLNHRHDIDGILVQMPLPKQIDSRRVLEAVAADKDPDGFHPLNVGHLVAGRPAPRACTPAGIIEMLKHYNIAMDGRKAVVVGRSDIVGKPMAMLLLQENATVTVCHSRTRDLPGVCRTADILVAAIGRPAMITADYMSPGAVVIDVGMNKVESRAEAERIFDPGRLADFDRRGSLLVGDVHPGDMARAASAYTPVPGGVGPLTIAMLMSNTIESAERRTGLC
jgi:methylenetetrahydrofolate dehydrogenase (NADP+)/methenyltetrahydrofolate cyclohydrolase